MMSNEAEYQKLASAAATAAEASSKNADAAVIQAQNLLKKIEELLEKQKSTVQPRTEDKEPKAPTGPDATAGTGRGTPISHSRKENPTGQPARDGLTPGLPKPVSSPFKVKFHEHKTPSGANCNITFGESSDKTLFFRNGLFLGSQADFGDDGQPPTPETTAFTNIYNIAAGDL